MIEKDPCGNCGSTEYRFWRMWYDGKEGDRIRREACDVCANAKPQYPRDAVGNKVRYSNELTGKYSYAIDAPITSQRQLSEHLKKNNLIQKA